LMQYWEQTRQAIRPLDIYIGLGKSLCFAVLVAAAGCLKGLQCGRSAGDVGRAATAAVVAGIVAIIVADGIFAVICDILGV
ncbi:MAG: ABC transporter permease, partial [Desulfobacterales bacterium]